MSLIASTLLSVSKSADLFSDIILHAGKPIYNRTVQGFKPVNDRVITDAEIEAFLTSLPDWPRHEKRSHDAGRQEVDMAAVINGTRFRINAFRFEGGTRRSVVMRVINSAIRTIEELGLPVAVLDFVDRRSGNLLICGPAGSGKSTTMAALLNHISQTRHDHIITAEDPIEYLIPSAKGIVTQREIGSDSSSFAAALRAAMREAPDVIMVGEIRDRETAESFLMAGETGHLVLGTLHSSSAAKAVERLTDFFPVDDKPMQRNIIASHLVGVVCQTLVPSSDESRKVLAYEIMRNTTAIATHIREDKLNMIANTMQTSGDSSMMTLNKCLSDQVRSGLVSMDMARRAAYDQTGFDLATNTRTDFTTTPARAKAASVVRA